MVKMLREAKFECSKADPDVWYQAAMKVDGFKYYEYVLVYIDDQYPCCVWEFQGDYGLFRVQVHAEEGFNQGTGLLSRCQGL
jgi:hypothetical protein